MKFSSYETFFHFDLKVMCNNQGKYSLRTASIFLGCLYLSLIFATSTKIFTKLKSILCHQKKTSSFNSHPSTLKGIFSFSTLQVKFKFQASASSIFRANSFGQWVITHSLNDSNFHGHIPTVYMNQHLLWYLISL